MNRFHQAKSLVVDLPRKLRLAYCLLRDPRVPVVYKGLLAGSVVLFVGPTKLPRRIRFLGEIDMVTLTVASLTLFIVACPLALVAEHEQKIIERQSIFDEDLRQGEEIVRGWIVTLLRLPKDEIDMSTLIQKESA